ncbi:hypothetical protein EMIT0196P_230019 [Pseudomonas chlororaphis]
MRLLRRRSQPAAAATGGRGRGRAILWMTLANYADSHPCPALSLMHAPIGLNKKGTHS